MPFVIVKGQFVGTSCVETVGELSASTPVNFGQHFSRQREMPWLAIVPAPKDADRKTLAMCSSAADAINVSMAFKGRNFSARWFAQRLDVDPAYLCRLRKGRAPLAADSWFVDAFCALTGTNLLRQWFALDAALNPKPNESDRIERIAAQLRSAA